MMTDSLSYTRIPAFAVDGEERPSLAADLIHVEFEEDTSGLRTMRATFNNWGALPGSEFPTFRYWNGTVFDFGRSVAVWMGALGDGRPVFLGKISAIECRLDEGHAPEIVILAEDGLMDLRMTRRSRTYENSSDEEIARITASAHGLRADVDAPGPTYNVVQQWNQSDLAFLRERALRIGAEVSIDDQTLTFKARRSREGSRIALAQGGDLLSVRIRADLAHQRTRIRVTGYDANARDIIDEDATQSVILEEANGGQTGPAILERAFGERVSIRTRDVPLNRGEARDRARVEFLRRARGFLRLTGVARGCPEMVVGSRVSLERVGAPFEGDDYYVTRVVHTFSPRPPGFRTIFEAERATLSGAGLQ